MIKRVQRHSVDLTGIDEVIEEMAANEKRNKTSMIRVLLDEAIKARTKPCSDEEILSKAIALLKKAAKN